MGWKTCGIHRQCDEIGLDGDDEGVFPAASRPLGEKALTWQGSLRPSFETPALRGLLRMRAECEAAI
ncbi:hypothetical protein XH96_06780 [Bradyrhizobium sp. CCBAU 51765]|nr:hypothetical protein XH96_06780 [Bradyrhizobium sp. CCBAU 51765]